LMLDKQNMKKELIITIPGSKYIFSNKKALERVILFLYGLVNIFKPASYNYAKTFSKEFKSKDRDVKWLHWNRGFTLISEWLGEKHLEKEIEKNRHKYRKINLVGISIGGDMALKAGKKFDDGTIDRIILICSTNTFTKLPFKTIKVINIYSPYDLFAKIFSKVLAPLHGGTFIKGKNVVNISIRHFSHNEFCTNEKIKSGKYKGKRISDLVKKFL